METVDLRQYHAIAEQAIANLGLSPAECSGEELGIWHLKKGSARVTLEVFMNPENDTPYCRVICPVMPIPEARRNELYSELLDINMAYIGVTFAKTDDRIFVKADREAEGLDVNELFVMLNRIGNLADYYDDILQEKYGVASPEQTEVMTEPDRKTDQ